MTIRCLWAVGLAAALAVAAPADDPIARATALLDEAGALLDQGKPAEALAKVKEASTAAADKSPAIAVACLMLEGRAEAARERWDAAATALNTLTVKFADAPQAPDAACLIAAVRRRQERPVEARQLYERVLTTYPDSWGRMEAERGLIRLALDTNLEDATQRLDAYLTRYPWTDDGPWLLDELGAAQLAAKQGAAAAATYERIRRDYGGTQAAFEARRGLVDAYRAAERWDDALRVLTEAAGEGPEMFAVAEITMLHAELLEAKGDRAAAAEMLGGLAGRYPGTFVAARAALRRSELLLALERKDDAVAAVEPLRDTFTTPYWKVQVLRVLMDVYHQAGQYDQAEDSAAALIELTDGTPLGASALLQMALSQKEAGRLRAARGSLERLTQKYKGPPFVTWAQQLMADWEAEGAGNVPG